MALKTFKEYQAIVMETMQLDEISDKTLASYRDKSFNTSGNTKRESGRELAFLKMTPHNNPKVQSSEIINKAKAEIKSVIDPKHHSKYDIDKITSNENARAIYKQAAAAGHLKEEVESIATTVTESTLHKSDQNFYITRLEGIIEDINENNSNEDQIKLINDFVTKYKNLFEPKFHVADKTTEKELTYDEALEYVKTLGAGWRLPTKVELIQLYRSNNNFQKAGYMSNTPAETGYVYKVSFTKGMVMDISTKSGKALVRAVKD